MSDDLTLDHDPHDDDWNGTRADRLISRIVDRRATPEDWSSFAALAHAEPAHWEQLMVTLRADGALRTAVAGAFETADHVETPLPSLSRWRQWTGWAAASVLALCWAGSSYFAFDAGAAAPTQTASRPADPHVAQAPPETPGWGARPGTASVPVVEELPLRFMGTRPDPSGRGLEVLYMRPVIERTFVDGVYSLATDELGRSTTVEVDPATLAASNNKL